ncbi:hypothetical protein FC961_12855 [Clostridium botulinum]|nr:hypothetical protein [Clostridium botulinum]NFO92467.1 hypothetical protein [Clostridium botulinum]
MYFKKENYTNDMEILFTRNNLVTESATIVDTGVTADNEGNKYVTQGTLIDSTGAVVTQKGSGGSETLSATPVGILYRTVNVKNGSELCSLIIEGYVRTDRVLGDFAEAAQKLIKAALPKVTFK